jgi:hypothetical protein
MTAPATTEQVADVSFRNSAYNDQADARRTCDDVYEGTSAIRRERTLYIPQNPGEDNDKYERRVKRSHFYNMFEPTVQGLVGLIFRKPPVLADGAGPLITAQVENIDGRGTHLAVFSRELAEAAMKSGHAAILVDAPPAPNIGRKPTKADVARLGNRPTWAMIRAEQVINFREDIRPNGEMYFTLLVVEECIKQPVGDFGEKEMYRWRVFRDDGAGTITWEIWISDTGKRDGAKAKYRNGVIANVTEIPIAPLYAGRRSGTFCSKPPLLSLAELNLDLFAVQLDHRYAMHVSNTPIPIFKGRKKTPKQPLGAEVGIDLDADANAGAFYLESNGNGLAASRQEQLDLIQRATIFGLQMLAPQTRAIETAQSKIIDQAEKTSRLAVIARALQDALERALGFHSAMIGEPAASVKINLDVSGLTLDAATLTAYTALVTSRIITPRTLYAIMQEAGALPEDFDADAEEQSLDELNAFDAASDPAGDPNPNADPTKIHPADPVADPAPDPGKKAAAA